MAIAATQATFPAVESGNLDGVQELLINAGADIAAVDAKGKTALAHAREHGLRRIQESLLAHSAA